MIWRTSGILNRSRGAPGWNAGVVEMSAAIMEASPVSGSIFTQYISLLSLRKESMPLAPLPVPSAALR